MLDEFLHVNDAMVEGDGFEDGVSDVYVVDACSALASAAKDGFDDYVAAEFVEGFKRFIDAFGCEGSWDWHANVFE
jgi:hypothetical protein